MGPDYSREVMCNAAAIVRFFYHPNSNLPGYQIKGMNLRNMNMGNANAVKLDKICELTLYVPW